MTLRFVLALGTLALAALLAPATSSAQTRDANGVLHMERVVIPGRVQRPGAIVTLARSRTRHEPAELRASHVREVVRAVTRRPF